MSKLALLGFVMLVGCKKAPPPVQTREPKPPPSATWERNQLELGDVDGHQGSGLYFAIDGAKLGVRTVEWYGEGPDLTVGTEHLHLADKARKEWPIAAQLGGLALDFRAPQDVALKLPVVLSIPGWAPVETTLPPLTVRGSDVAAVFRRVDEGPIAFEGEPAAAAPKLAILYLVREWMRPSVLGAGAHPHLRDVDWVALEKHQKQGDRRCGGYSSTSGKGGATSVTVVFEKSIVTLYDRRTGGALGARTFLAPEVCPSVAVGGAADTHVDRARLEAWVKHALDQGKVTDVDR